MTKEQAAEKHSEERFPITDPSPKPMVKALDRQGAFYEGFMKGWEVSEDNRWRKLEEEFPEARGTYIFGNDKKRLVATHYVDVSNPYDQKFMLTKFTHWQPVPQPPKI